MHGQPNAHAAHAFPSWSGSCSTSAVSSQSDHQAASAPSSNPQVISHAEAVMAAQRTVDHRLSKERSGHFMVVSELRVAFLEDEFTSGLSVSPVAASQHHNWRT